MYAHHAYVHVSDASTYSSADDAASAFVAVNPPFLLFPFSSNGHTSEDMDEDDMDDIRIVRSQLTLSLPDSPSLLLVLLLPLCMPLPPHVMPRTFALILCVTPRVARPPRCISLGGIFLSVAVAHLYGVGDGSWCVILRRNYWPDHRRLPVRTFRRQRVDAVWLPSWCCCHRFAL